MSDLQNHRSSEVMASDTSTEAEADQPGIGGSVTQAEIDDVVNNVQMPIEERVERLKALTARLGTRANIDSGDEFDPLSAQISEAMNMLADGGHVYGTAGAAGLDTDGSSKVRSPDDFSDDETR